VSSSFIEAEDESSQPLQTEDVSMATAISIHVREEKPNVFIEAPNLAK
jgi:hypothetical protein